MTETRATFILRLWREAGDPAGVWRAEVEHLQAQEVGRFGDLTTLWEFVSRRLAEVERDRLEATGAGDE